MNSNFSLVGGSEVLVNLEELFPWLCCELYAEICYGCGKGSGHKLIMTGKFGISNSGIQGSPVMNSPR